MLGCAAAIAFRGNYTDMDYIDFATNVECLEGLFDTWGTFGRGFLGAPLFWFVRNYSTHQVGLNAEGDGGHISDGHVRYWSCKTRTVSGIAMSHRCWQLGFLHYQSVWVSLISSCAPTRQHGAERSAADRRREGEPVG
jgi:hypothetical protein